MAREKEGDLEAAPFAPPRADARRLSRKLPMAMGLVALTVIASLVVYMRTTQNLQWERSTQRSSSMTKIENVSPLLAAEEVKGSSSVSLTEKRFAYMFYITKDIYACAVLHLLRQLVHVVHANTSSIDFVVLHTPGVSAAMLERIPQHVSVRFIPVDAMLADATEPTWHESLTKLLIFRDWGYDRVVYLDADSVPLQNLDHLFELPPATLYAPRAYWLPQPFFASALLVIEPLDGQFEAMITWARARGRAAGFDMDILNAFFKDSVQYLPGDYTVLNSDFRAVPNASNKLYATTTELKQHAQLVHFSCTPNGSYGKPWTTASRNLTFATLQGFDPLFASMYEDFWATQDRFCQSR